MEWLSDGQPPQGQRPRRPAVTVAVALAAGILLDRTVPLPWTTWLPLGLLAVAAGVVFGCRRCGAAGALAVLAAWLCVGAARHHAVWSVAREHDVALYATDEARPVRLEAVVVSDPVIRPKVETEIHSAWPKLDTTWCDLQCETLVGGSERPTVSGRARLCVRGHLLHAAVGDRVEVRGWMRRPAGPSNPGEFDYRDYLRRQGIGCLVYCETPDAVVRMERGRTWTWRRAISGLRGRCRAVFARHLDPEQAAIAAALVFGDVSGLDIARLTELAESGTIHVVSVSGLHVAILVGFCWGVCRLLSISRLGTTVVVLSAVIVLALLAEARPPVVRAGVLAALWLLGRHGSRHSDPVNALAVAALVVLLWRPVDLFDVGAQLSFLAVMGILWSGILAPDPADEADALPPDDGLLPQVRSRFVQTWRVMLGVWIWTAPLVAWAFHLISPVGLAANLVLVPLSTGVLWTGYLLMLCAALVPPLAVVFGWGMQWGLWAFTSLAGWSAAVEAGHVYAAGPPGWWLFGCYAVLLACCARRGLTASRCRRWGLICGWLAVGLAVGLLPARPHGLRCTFLAVGHGGAVLVELPDGRTLLYDAGAIDDARRPQRIVQQALWDRGHVGADALVVSHADLDHMNAVPGLLQTVPVGQLLVARSFLDFDQSAVQRVCETAFTEGVPIRLIWEQDRLMLHDAVSIRVLHPPAGYGSPHDNANSLVLQIDYAGRRILLTGDLERDGLQRMLSQPPRPVDVLQSPHHGSPAPNSVELARWARPGLVVVCSGRTRSLPQLRRTYGGPTRVWSTAEYGAVTVTIRPDGTLHTERFRFP